MTTAPLIGGVSPDTGWSSTDGVTDAASVSVFGTADMGDVVTLSESVLGTVGSAWVDMDGNWSIAVSELADGDYQFTAVSEDSIGVPSEPSTPLAVTVDTTAPADTRVDGITPDTGDSWTDGVTSIPNFTVIGSADVGTLVSLSEATLGALGSAVVDSNGRWSIPVPGALAEGDYQFVVWATDLAGNISGLSSPLAIHLDATAPEIPSINGITPDTGSSDQDGVTNSAIWSVHGTSEPFTHVLLQDSSGLIHGSGQAGSDGSWSIAAPTDLADGTYEIRVSAADVAGNISGASGYFTVVLKTDSAAMAAPTLQRDMSDLTQLSLIASGTAAPDAPVTLTQVGTTRTWEATADSDGDWTITTGAVQAVGGFVRFSAQAEDLAGNLSTPSVEALFRPSFVLINADDQGWNEVHGFMPQTEALLANSGTVFEQNYATTGLSGPSRASLLTGQYAHHTGELLNDPPYGGAGNFNATQTLATVLDEAGYYTGLVGKYETRTLDGNYYAPVTNPPGWDEYHSMVKQGDATQGIYYGYTLSDNGVLRTYGNSVADYSTTVLSAKADEFIEGAATNANRPFFLYFAIPAPHAPYLLDPKYAGTLSGLAPNRPPSFNLPAPGISALTESRIAQMDLDRQRHLELLGSVDDAIASLYDTLASTGQLANTIFIYTADNGLSWGEHSLIGKGREYQESIHTPLIVRDSRAPLAQVRNEFSLNIDLAPTLESWAGVPIPPNTDGQSLTAIIAGESPSWRTDFLGEHVDTFDYSRRYMLRTERYVYIEAPGGNLLFDLQTDPYELTNIYYENRNTPLVAALAARLHQLKPTDVEGPSITSASVESIAGAPQLLRLTVQESDVLSGGSQVRMPEYFIDAIGMSATGKFIPSVTGHFTSVTATAAVDISIRDLTPGRHVLYVHGRDTHGNWGPFTEVPFVVGYRGTEIPVMELAAGNAERVEITVDTGTLTLNDSVPGGLTPGQIYGNGTNRLVIDNAGTSSLDVTLASAGGLTYTPGADFVGKDEVQLNITIQGSEQRIALPIFVTPAPPFLANLGQTLSYEIGSGFQSVAASATLQSFSGRTENATLTISFPNSFGGSDRLAIRNQGNAAGQVGVGSGVVRYGGVPIGTFSYVTPNTGPLIVQFNAAATVAGIQAVARAVVYQNVSLTPTLNPRAIRLLLVDGDGTVGNAATNIMQPMSLSGISSSVAYDATNTPVRLAPAGALSSGSTSLVGAKLTAVSLNGDGNDLISIQPTLTQQLNGLVTTVGNDVLVDSVVIGTFTGGAGTTPLVVTFNENVRLASVTAVLRSLSYSNVATKPSLYTRNLQVGFSLSGGSSLSPKSLIATVQIPDWISGLNFASFYVANGSPVSPASNVVVSDPSVLYSNSKLSAALVVAEDADRLEFENQGTSEGQVSVSGNELNYGGLSVGTYAGGAATDPLVVIFNSSATEAAVRAVARSIIYYNGSSAPRPFVRPFQMLYTSGNGKHSLPVTSSIVVNSNPMLVAGHEATVIEAGGPAGIVDANLVVNDPDDFFQFTTLSVDIADGDANDRLSIRHQGMAADQVGVSGNSISYGGVAVATIVGGSSGTDPLLIAFNAHATQRVVQSVARQVQYASVSRVPNGTGRTIQFQLTDGGGLTSTIVQKTVQYVYAPEVSATVTQLSYPIGTVGVRVVSDATITKREGLLAGSTCYTVLTNGGGSDRLIIRTGGSGPSAVSVSGANISYGGAAVGSFQGGIGATPLVVTFLTSASDAAVQAVLRSIAYKNTSSTPATFLRSFQLQVTDSTGLKSAVIARSIAPVHEPVNAPVAVSGSLDTNEDTAAGGTLVATDMDGDTLTYSIVGNPAHGVVTMTDAVMGTYTYTPHGNYNGTDSFTFRANDGMVDGNTATINVTVSAVNDAPALNTAASPSLSSVAEDEVNPPGTPISQLLGGVSDVDAGALQGVAITHLPNFGLWQCSTDGGSSWTTVGAPTVSSALLLRSTDLLRLTPKANYNGTATLWFRAWDQTDGQSPGSIVDTGINGGTTAYSRNLDSATLTVAPVNDAPVLNTAASPSLSSVAEDEVNPSGTPVSQLLGGVSDLDAGALQGVAITHLPNFGVWQYSTDGGLSWAALGSPTVSAAVVLKSTDLLWLKPNTDFNGTTTLWFRAWDQSDGLTSGSIVDTSANGGATAYSKNVDSATLTVTPVNDAPKLNTSFSPTLSSVAQNDPNPPGTLISQLLGGVTDVDAGALQGAAITHVPQSVGNWEYSLDGGSTWLAAGTPSVAAALVLRSTDLIRLRPKLDYTGTVDLWFRAWDQSDGLSAGSIVDTSIKGDTTAYSKNLDSASITVTP